jgi:hypothetical protein
MPKSANHIIGFLDLQIQLRDDNGKINGTNKANSEISTLLTLSNTNAHAKKRSPSEEGSFINLMITLIFIPAIKL